MWGSDHVKSFWNELQKFTCQNCENVHNFKFNEKIILFGTDINSKTNKSDNNLDFIILSAKLFIYSCRHEKKINQVYVHSEKS